MEIERRKTVLDDRQRMLQERLENGEDMNAISDFNEDDQDVLFDDIDGSMQI
jgi:hypothetical protein